MPSSAQDLGFRIQPGLRQQQELQIAKKYVVLNCGGPMKCGSPTTRTCRDKLFIQGNPTVMDLGIFGNIFKILKISDREEEKDTYDIYDIYILDCSKLPEGYFCFMTTETDPHTHAVVMHHGIPIFYFMKPTSSTNPLYHLIGYEAFFERDGGFDLTRMRHELQQKMSIPKQTSSSSLPPGLTYQQGRRIHLQLRNQLDRIGRPYPKEIIRRIRDMERFLVANQPKRGGR
jgi:hypothetical protein